MTVTEESEPTQREGSGSGFQPMRAGEFAAGFAAATWGLVICMWLGFWILPVTVPIPTSLPVVSTAIGIGVWGGYSGIRIVGGRSDE